MLVSAVNLGLTRSPKLFARPCTISMYKDQFSLAAFQLLADCDAFELPK